MRICRGNKTYTEILMGSESRIQNSDPRAA